MVSEELKNELPELLRFNRPTTKHHLQDYLRYFLGVDLPSKVMLDGHSSPMDYVWYAFNSDFLQEKRANCDLIVWANRGGGKTETAAIATLLDCIFKPKIEIRILSGSGYQAGRMYEYFEQFLRMGYENCVADSRSHPVKTKIFTNGAKVEVLVQSETSVRGQHVNKLRCDEVELFKPRVFEAAQYTTKTSNGYSAALEVISTKHKPRGLMSKIIKEADARGIKIFKWNIWDVIEKCKKQCKDCPIESICKKQAQKGSGFITVDDVITQFERTSRVSFSYEMLCGEGGKKFSFWKFIERLY